MIHLRKCVAGILCLSLFTACSKSSDSVDTTQPPVTPPVVTPVTDTALTKTAHLEKLSVPVSFVNGEKAIGVYIYSDAPFYTPVEATGEGFTCVDDVARAALYYTRSYAFATDTAIQNRAFGMIKFVLNMQSDNGYFYNFLQTDGSINQYGITSVNQPKWWSWRALQVLAEGVNVVRTKDATLAGRMGAAVNKLVAAIKTDLVDRPQVFSQVDGIDVPQWLPEGADQASTLILGLVPYCRNSGDAVIRTFIQKLADGIVASQSGSATQFPYGAFLSASTTWHAYGNDQAHALFTAGAFLNDASYVASAKKEVDNFYPWLLTSGMKSSFQVKLVNNVLTGYNQKDFEQIAYGIRPMVFAAIDAYAVTGDERYSDMAGHLGAWLLGNNVASENMYSVSTGICFDAIAAPANVNKNSGAESTVEALLTMQQITNYTTVRTALNRYKR